ncbi:MAG: hypothetical protein G8237_12955 [Magnetococcales bacterium]|nr:hypothetical protein [Magnetococcales bacterium]
MTWQQADIDEIVALIKPQITLWMAERGPDPSAFLFDREILERIVRVEEGLKHQRELMQQGFELINSQLLQHKEMTLQWMDQVNKRFEQVDKRFEQVDKRFEQVDKRFEQIDKRFEQIDKRFEQIENRLDLIEKHLEQVDHRFEQMDRRFEQMDRRFEQLTQRLDRFMFWSFGVTITTAGMVITVLKFWH